MVLMDVPRCAEPEGGVMSADRIARRAEGNDLRLELGERPVWDVGADALWWVDSETGEVYRGSL